MAMFQAASMKIIVSKFYLFELAISLIVSRQFHTFATASPSEFRQLQKFKFYKKKSPTGRNNLHRCADI